MSSIEKLDEQIADCLAGNGTFDDLQRLKAEKAVLIDRRHFDNLQSLKQQIRSLEAQRVIDYDDLNGLQSELQAASLVVDEKAGILLEARREFAELEGKIYFKREAIDQNKTTIKEKKAELENLISEKITEQI